MSQGPVRDDDIAAGEDLVEKFWIRIETSCPQPYVIAQQLSSLSRDELAQWFR